MSKLALKLKARLETEFCITGLIPKIHRTRAGYWQRLEGSWSWFMLCEDGTDVGSQWSASVVANAKRLSITCTIRSIIIDVEEK